MPKDFIGGVIYIVKNYYPLLLEGVKVTLLVSIISTLIGCVVGLFVAVFRNTTIHKKDKFIMILGKKVIKFILSFYVEFIRGTPMMVQAMFIYYGSKSIGMNWSVITASIFIVSFNTGAYIAEIMRGGILSIDKGQEEGARALGLTKWQSMIHVIIPQALRNSLPAIGNEFVVNIKDTSVLNLIALNELYLQTRTISGIHYRTAETFFVSAIVYFILTFCITRILLFLEKKYDKGKSSSQIPNNRTINIRRNKA